MYRAGLKTCTAGLKTKLAPGTTDQDRQKFIFLFFFLKT